MFACPKILWRRLQPLLERYAPVFTAFWAGMLALALLIAFLPWFQDTPHVAGAWLTPWTWPHMEVLAAWVQAIGSIAAIYFAGRGAERLFNRQRAVQHEEARLRALHQSLALDSALRNLARQWDPPLGDPKIPRAKSFWEHRFTPSPATLKALEDAISNAHIYGADLTEQVLVLDTQIRFIEMVADLVITDGQSHAEATASMATIQPLPKDALAKLKQALQPFLPQSRK